MNRLSFRPWPLRWRFSISSMGGCEIKRWRRDGEVAMVEKCPSFRDAWRHRPKFETTAATDPKANAIAALRLYRERNHWRSQIKSGYRTPDEQKTATGVGMPPSHANCRAYIGIGKVNVGPPRKLPPIGPGGTTPAMLAPGEFHVSASEVAKLSPEEWARLNLHTMRFGNGGPIIRLPGE